LFGLLGGTGFDGAFGEDGEFIGGSGLDVGGGVGGEVGGGEFDFGVLAGSAGGGGAAVVLCARGLLGSEEPVGTSRAPAVPRAVGGSRIPSKNGVHVDQSNRLVIWVGTAKSGRHRGGVTVIEVRVEHPLREVKS
jgi:hypothetical protein